MYSPFAQAPLAPPADLGRGAHATSGTFAVGPYEPVRRIGVSAASEVVLANARGPLGFERAVVLKRLLADVPPEDRVWASARLAREALAYARLTHPAVVRLYDFVEHQGRLTLVLEHVDGLSLARVVSGLAKTGGQLTEAAALYVGYRLFLALAAAHAARDPATGEYAPVIHRDVCPSNVLVPWDGYVKLTDFGVARVAGIAADTRPGIVKGTAGYLSPEEVRGAAVTVRTDVYCASLVVRELLVGAPAFPLEHITERALFDAMAHPSFVPLSVLKPSLPLHVTDAIDRALAADPERRIASADEMAAVLKSAIDVDAARERLAQQIAPLRRETVPPPASARHATVPDDGASFARDASLFDESAPHLPPRPSEPMHGASPLGPPTTQAMTMRATMRAAPSVVPPPMMISIAPPAPVSAHAGGRAAHTGRSTLQSRTTSSAFIVEAPPSLTHANAASRRGSSAALAAGAALAIAMGIGIGGVLGWLEREGDDARPHASAGTTTSASADAPPLALARTPRVRVTDITAGPRAARGVARPLAESVATTGLLLTPASEAGHRIFVDGRFAGAGGKPLVVACGAHDVRIGSAGRLRKVVVPCGGQVEATR